MTPENQGGAHSARSRRACRACGAIPALSAEVESAALVLRTPAARLIASGDERPLCSKRLKRCWHRTRLSWTHAATSCAMHDVVSLASRPVLFALARVLAEAWPGDVSRDTLLARTFGARVADDLIVRDYESRSGGSARRFDRWLA